MRTYKHLKCGGKDGTRGIYTVLLAQCNQVNGPSEAGRVETCCGGDTEVRCLWDLDILHVKAAVPLFV